MLNSRKIIDIRSIYWSFINDEIGLSFEQENFDDTLLLCVRIITISSSVSERARQQARGLPVASCVLKHTQ